MRPGAFDQGPTLDPIYERIMATPGDMLDTLYNSIGAVCQFGESGPCPPRQVVGRRIEQEIRDAGQRGWDVGVEATITHGPGASMQPTSRSNAARPTFTVRSTTRKDCRFLVARQPGCRFEEVLALRSGLLSYRKADL